MLEMIFTLKELIKPFHFVQDKLVYSNKQVRVIHIDNITYKKYHYNGYNLIQHIVFFRDYKNKNEKH